MLGADPGSNGGARDESVVFAGNANDNLEACLPADEGGENQ